MKDADPVIDAMDPQVLRDAISIRARALVAMNFATDVRTRCDLETISELAATVAARVQERVKQCKTW